MESQSHTRMMASGLTSTNCQQTKKSLSVLMLSVDIRQRGRDCIAIAIPKTVVTTSTHNLNQKTLTGHGRVLTSLTSSPSGHSM